MKWRKRWEAAHPYYRMRAYFTGHQKQLVVGSSYRGWFCYCKNRRVQVYCLEEDLERKTQESLKILMNKEEMKGYFIKVNKNHEEILAYLKKILGKMKKLNDEELVKAYEDYYEKLEFLFCTYDLSRPEFLQTPGEILKKELGEEKFAILTRPSKDNFLGKQEIEWIELLLEAKKHPGKKDALIQKHHSKYAWIGMSEHDKPWDIDYYQSLYLEYQDSDIEELEKQKNRIVRDKQVLKKQQEILEKKLSAKTKRLLQVVRELAHLRLQTRFIWVESGHMMNKIFKELAQRKNIPVNELEKYSPEEMRLILQGKQLSPDTLKSRDEYVFKLLTGKLEEYYGRDAFKIKNKELPVEKYNGISELKGKIANKGKAKGSAKIITAFAKNQTKEEDKVKQGDILVTSMTRPHLIRAIKKSSAIVTDEGGITSHAAIISRELNKPCVIDTKIATKIFKDGDLIEVDADNGIVRKL